MQIQILWLLVLIVLVILASGMILRDAYGKVYSPWITSEHVADTSSLEAFREFPAWRDKSGPDLALAVWR
ncbi:MAG: hypothetical protein ACE5JL_11720, partial [Dehalococcoidia bacterium]